MDTKLDDLDPTFKSKAIELIARCVEAALAVIIIDTRRTPEEQASAIRRGVSWTQDSKHLTGKAIDLAPYQVYQLHGADKIDWDAADQAWQTMGRIGESLGLVWGGRWTHRDMGHFEESEP